MGFGCIGLPFICQTRPDNVDEEIFSTLNESGCELISMAIEAGNVRVANVIMLGAFVGASDVVAYKNLEIVLKEKLGRKKALLDMNLKVLKQGFDLGRKALRRKERA